MSSSTIECLCCFSDTPKSSTIKCNGSKHHRFCFDCMRSRITTSLDTHKIELGCMNTGECSGEFLEQDLSKFLDPGLLERFYKVQQKIYIREAFGDELVACPFCSIEMLQDGRSDNNILICINQECNRASCTLCKKDVHYPDPCSEMDRERIQKEESDTYKIIKACPTCNVDIFKTEGCSHMKCSRCSHTMCYICGVDITADVWGHGCPVFTDTARDDIEVIREERPQRHAREERPARGEQAMDAAIERYMDYARQLYRQNNPVQQNVVYDRSLAYNSQPYPLQNYVPREYIPQPHMLRQSPYVSPQPQNYNYPVDYYSPRRRQEDLDRSMYRYNRFNQINNRIEELSNRLDRTHLNLNEYERRRDEEERNYSRNYRRRY